MRVFGARLPGVPAIGTSFPGYSIPAANRTRLALQRQTPGLPELSVRWQTPRTARAGKTTNHETHETHEKKRETDSGTARYARSQQTIMETKEDESAQTTKQKVGPPIMQRRRPLPPRTAHEAQQSWRELVCPSSDDFQHARARGVVRAQPTTACAGGLGQIDSRGHSGLLPADARPTHDARGVRRHPSLPPLRKGGKFLATGTTKPAMRERPIHSIRAGLSIPQAAAPPR